MDVSGIAEVIDQAADVFERKAFELRQMSKSLRNTGDLSIAGEAISTCMNLGNIRGDLLSIRPVRMLEREIERLEQESERLQKEGGG